MDKRIGTVCFIIQDNNILLALIEYGPNDRKWNGIGGHVDSNESPEDAVVREFSEETYIKVNKNDLIKVLEINSDIKLLVYKTNHWQGEIKAKEISLKEFRWFDKDEIPFDQMYPDNKEWLPKLFVNEP